MRAPGGLTVHTAAERPDLDERADGITREIWPEYNTHGDAMAAHWPALTERWADFQFVLVDAGEELVAQGHMIPCRWDGTVDGLPAGIDAVIEQGATLTGPPNAASAIAAEIRPAWQGRGLAITMIETMKAICAQHGLPQLIAPVRPSHKERYPLTPIGRYAAWTRADGLPLDPWMRVHVRAGGRVLRPVPRSLRISGTVEEWEAWTGLAYPESGEYVFPHGLAPLTVDRERGEGLYFEPNVWMGHPVG